MSYTSQVRPEIIAINNYFVNYTKNGPVFLMGFVLKNKLQASLMKSELYADKYSGQFQWK